MAKQTRRDVLTLTLPHLDGEMLVRRLADVGGFMTTAEPELSALAEEFEIGEFVHAMATILSPIATADPAAVAMAAEESMAAFAREHLRSGALGGIVEIFFGDDVEIVFGDDFAVQSTRGIEPYSLQLQERCRSIHGTWFWHLELMVVSIRWIIRQREADGKAEEAASA